MERTDQDRGRYRIWHFTHHEWPHAPKPHIKMTWPIRHRKEITLPSARGMSGRASARGGSAAPSSLSPHLTLTSEGQMIHRMRWSMRYGYPTEDQKT